MSVQESSILVVNPIDKELNEARIRRILSRRRFLRGVGLAGAGVAGASLLSGCGGSRAFGR